VYYSGGHHGYASACGGTVISSEPTKVYEGEGRPVERIEGEKVEGAEKLPEPETNAAPAKAKPPKANPPKAKPPKADAKKPGTDT